MSYRSVIAIVVAASSMLCSGEAAARPIGQALGLALKQNVEFASYELQPSSQAPQLTAPTIVRTVSGQIVSLDSDQATRSAAYKWEAGFLALSAIDAAETISCLDHNRCTEGNFIWGRHPSSGKIVAAKAALGLIHFGLFKLMVDHDPHTALRVAQISAAVQGGFVLLNVHRAF